MKKNRLIHLASQKRPRWSLKPDPTFTTSLTIWHCDIVKLQEINAFHAMIQVQYSKTKLICQFLTSYKKKENFLVFPTNKRTSWFKKSQYCDAPFKHVFLKVQIVIFHHPYLLNIYILVFPDEQILEFNSRVFLKGLFPTQTSRPHPVPRLSSYVRFHFHKGNPQIYTHTLSLFWSCHAVAL